MEIPLNVIQDLDTEDLFLCSVMLGRTQATEAFKFYPWFKISLAAKALAKQWAFISVNGLTSLAMVAIHDICLANGAQIPMNPVDPGINQTWELLKEWKPKVTNPLLRNWDIPNGRSIDIPSSWMEQVVHRRRICPAHTSHCMPDARVKVPMFKYLAREFILGLPTISSSTSSESGEHPGRQSVVR
jgi:hypothetical protein